MPLSRVEDAMRDLREGKMIIMVDDEDRENEGDLVMAAQFATPEAVNFMAKHGRGLICLTLTEERAGHLNLPLMVRENTSQFGTAFTVSIEARTGVTTGISAADRARTIHVAIDDSSTASDLSRPGHVFPLIARPGGVLQRTGQTEGSVDICRMAGVKPYGVICEIMKDDGTMARMPDLERFAAEWNLKIISVADIIRYRLWKERLVHRVSEGRLPTQYGEFRIIVYHNDVDSHEHVALIKGDVTDGEPTLVRVHSSCVTGDIFNSLRCDCGEQLHAAMRMVERAGKGVVLYLIQEGRGIGLANKIKAYNLQDGGMDTVEANIALGFKPDLRDFGIGAQILVDLGLKKLRLMTNNPKKIVGLEAYGMEVVDRVPIEIEPSQENLRYLKTKRDKLGHLLRIMPDGE
ncbi:MAG: bifunctional 3,4-dihydroxy-2-butanone-4-phosphate synthase/GTP cyclohydrolase II [Deltaproteobacteria bacterium]|nr:bifunctional 3,4-dihydroxy-2-butanone-4-phosphate synthase/GTP cyclohydrolase II [Deltaproteobacteria bacterium]